MRVKGGGRKKSWEAMPVDDDGDGGLLFQDTDPNVPFAVPEHQPFAVTEPQPQIEPENRPQAPEQGNDGDGEGEDGEGEGEEGEEGEAEADDENKERTTKLDEGFYEIEAIRRKRVRKVVLLLLSLSKFFMLLLEILIKIHNFGCLCLLYLITEFVFSCCGGVHVAKPTIGSASVPHQMVREPLPLIKSKNI